MTSQTICENLVAPGYNSATLLQESARLLHQVKDSPSPADARELILQNVWRICSEHSSPSAGAETHRIIRSRDCARALTSMLSERAEQRAGFSVAKALWNIATGWPRPDLQEGFYAEMIHLVLGLECRSPFHFLVDAGTFESSKGRDAAVARSSELDNLWAQVELRMAKIVDGMSDAAIARRSMRRAKVLATFGGSNTDWDDWKWQLAHIIDNIKNLARAVPLNAEEYANITAARAASVPFAITPYYASLFDADDTGDDRAIRAQVLPPADYVKAMAQRGDDIHDGCDFMREADTSPIDLVTRRYPAVVILKPYNTCPQLCVYCQRNWELKPAMAADALASDEKIDAAVEWIAEHPAIKEVLITGGDPLAMDDEHIGRLLEKITAIDSVDMIRIGTRVPVTLPMRITTKLAEMLGSFRKPGRRDIAIMTHVEHPYEITPDMVAAVDRIKKAGLSVYNQQVYTFYVSRRFETALLRMMLRRIGIDPYYTFAPKAKPETFDYRVPLARILQERKEEARLLPGLRRTDEPVFNVPGLGKNYLRAAQHHDVLAVMPDGARVYEFHPWEKNVSPRNTYVLTDTAILDYLRRLASIGEDPADYASIWYYF
ncbi:MAG: KamA family radical SAM protein [Planctomycetaceae bacterium]|nr:MAG: KamA family radical SAM protein [Planctomycetaceae bacterium]